MKLNKIVTTLILAAIVFVITGVMTKAQAQNFRIIPIEDSGDLRARVFRLENAVQELQAKIFMLQAGATASPTPDQKKFFCSLKNFDREYSAFGATTLEAKQAVIRQCTDAEKSAFGCKDPKCQKNE